MRRGYSVANAVMVRPMTIPIALLQYASLANQSTVVQASGSCDNRVHILHTSSAMRLSCRTLFATVSPPHVSVAFNRTHFARRIMLGQAALFPPVQMLRGECASRSRHGVPVAQIRMVAFATSISRQIPSPRYDVRSKWKSSTSGTEVLPAALP